jgi:hypothetical protein
MLKLSHPLGLMPRPSGLGHGRLTISSPAKRVPGPQRDAGYPLLIMLQRVDPRIASLARLAAH